jgi:hypothetical protein
MIFNVYKPLLGAEYIHHFYCVGQILQNYDKFMLFLDSYYKV